MKKININILFLGLLIIGTLTTQTSFARRPAAEKSPVKKQLIQLINKTVTTPDFKLNSAEAGSAVFVTFMVTAADKIKVENATGSSERLVEYVRQKLSEITASETIHSHNKKYSLTIRFDTI